MFSTIWGMVYAIRALKGEAGPDPELVMDLVLVDLMLILFGGLIIAGCLGYLD